MRKTTLGFAAMVGLVGCAADEPRERVGASRAALERAAASTAGEGASADAVGGAEGPARDEGFALVAVDETVSTGARDEARARLERAGVSVPVMLPGNLWIVRGLDANTPLPELGVAYTVHRRTGDGVWDREPARGDFHTEPSPLAPALLERLPAAVSEEVRARVLAELTRRDSRAQGVELAAAALDRLAQPSVEPRSSRELGGDAVAIEPELARAAEELERGPLESEGVLDESEEAPPVSDEARDELAQYTRRELASLDTGVAPTPSALRIDPGLSTWDFVGKSLRGLVTYTVFFPDSHHVGDEDWSASEASDQVSSLVSDLVAMAAVAPPQFNLHFNVQVVPQGSTANRVSVEPNKGPLESLWIRRLLFNQGLFWALAVPAITANQVFESMVASATGAAHATNVYVVHDAHGRANFNLPMFTGWPHAVPNAYFVMNSQPSFASGVYGHELMHTAHADDQYAQGGNPLFSCMGLDPVGAARARAMGAAAGHENANHAQCDPSREHQRSLMREGGERYAVDPVRRPILDVLARAQVGWGSTATVRVSLHGFEHGWFDDASAMAPGLRASVGLASHSGTRSFVRYVSDGPQTFRARRCTAHMLSGTTYRLLGAAAGSCTDMLSIASQTFDGDPSDIEGFSALDEGTVHEVHGFYTNGTTGTACPGAVQMASGATTQGTFDGANCWVDYVPPGRTGFTVGRMMVTTPSSGTCAMGSLAGPGCLVHQAAPGTSPFIFNGGYYTTPLPGNVCPAGTFDGANCYLGALPTGTTRFVWRGGVYLSPATGSVSCGASGVFSYALADASPSVNVVLCRFAEAPIFKEAFVYNGAFYYVP